MHVPDTGRRSIKITSKLLTVLQLIVCPLRSQTAPGESAFLEWNARYQCGKQHYQRAELSEAEGCYRSALAIAEQFARGDSRRGATLSELGLVLLEEGRISDAEWAGSKAVEAYRECGAARCGLGLATAMYSLANLYLQQNRRLEAERLLREALVQHTRAGGDETGTASILDGLGWLELNRGRPGAAESYFRRALALVGDIEGFAKTRGRLYTSLAFALLELNRARDAVEAARKAFTIASTASVIDPSAIVFAVGAFAAASVEIGDYALAERSLTHAEKMLSQIPAAQPRELGLILIEFGKLRYFQKRFAEAAEFHSRGIEILSRYLSADHPNILRSKANYAKVLRKLKRNQEAKRVEQEIRTASRQAIIDPDAKYRIDAADLQRRR